MSKDKIIGYILALLSLLAIILYTILLPIQYLSVELGVFNLISTNGDILGITWEIAMMIPVYLGFLMMALIALWIGWTMATTPPPEPLDLDSLEFDEESDEDSEEEE